MSALNFAFTLPDGLRVLATGDPASPILPRFFEGYDRAFVLPDEREEMDGFVKCLALNESHSHAFGRRHGELVVTIEDEVGTLLGGANFLATLLDPALDLDPDRRVDVSANAPSASVALNYVYVEEAARGRGLLRKILAIVRRLALEVLELDPEGAEPAIFIEQNDPLRLTAEEYAADTAHSGLDQVDRLAIWARMGTRVVDFPYVQPALSASQQADDGLIYAAVEYPGDTVERVVLKQHFESFFGISVLKGEMEQPGGAVQAQLDALAEPAGPLALLPMEPALAWMRDGRPVDEFASFRDLARTAGM